jgi:hypothetical protein
MVRIRSVVYLGALPVLVICSRSAGFSWPASILVALGPLVVAAGIAHRILFHRDVRMGLAPREWRALMAMARRARGGIKHDFDKTSLRSTRGVDTAVLTAYSTILLNLLVARKLGGRPTTEQIDQLVAEHGRAWQHITQREIGVLDHLVRAACRYRIDGYPEVNWDNYRALAVAAGVMRADPGSLRHSVLVHYQQASAVQGAEEPSDVER